MSYDFPNAPSLGQVANGYVWDGEKWKGTGSLPGPVVATKKNYIINGAMQVSQENGTTNGAVTAFYAVDMFVAVFVTSSGAMNVQQTATATPAGSPMRYRFAAVPANTSPAAGDYMLIRYTVEGLRMADLRFGFAAAKTVTLQFGVKAPAGTYCVSFRNGAFNRVYVAEYVISAGENLVDTQKAITLPGDVTGTWANDNTGGMVVDWVLMSGSTNKGATAGVWNTTNLPATNNQINAAATSAGFELFDVSLTEGTVAPPFAVPDYASELAACMRYFEKLETGTVSNRIMGSYPSAGQASVCEWLFKVRKRATPTGAFVGTSAGAIVDAASPDYIGLSVTGNYCFIGGGSAANARL